ncbi:MAG TPA: GIY-YIG nuclease family protein [Ktedonobacterales bacterium]
MDRKQMSKTYRERVRRGGVYSITNARNGRYLTGFAADLDSVRNRFQFAVTTGSAVDPRLRADWAMHGPAAFALDILGELERGPDQSDQEFLDDLKALEDLLRAPLDPSLAY